MVTINQPRKAIDMPIQSVRIEYKSLKLVVDFDHRSGAVYCTDTYTGEEWAYGSHSSYLEEMSPLLARRGYTYTEEGWAYMGKIYS